MVVVNDRREAVYEALHVDCNYLQYISLSLSLSLSVSVSQWDRVKTSQQLRERYSRTSLRV